jgi:hypothetical protein
MGSKYCHENAHNEAEISEPPTAATHACFRTVFRLAITGQ